MSEKVFDGGLIPATVVALGIDPSLSGFALAAVSVASPNQYEVWVYKSPLSGVARLADIRQWLLHKFAFLHENMHTIYDVAIEAAILASPSSLPLGELGGLVKLTLWDHLPEGSTSRTPLKIAPMTLKKFAAGKGNAKKQEMLLQIYKRWGAEFNDDNAADAYALARLATGVSINDVEEKIVEQIKDLKYRDSQ